MRRTWTEVRREYFTEPFSVFWPVVSLVACAAVLLGLLIVACHG